MPQRGGAATKMVAKLSPKAFVRISLGIVESKWIILLREVVVSEDYSVIDNCQGEKWTRNVLTGKLDLPRIVKVVPHDGDHPEARY